MTAGTAAAQWPERPTAITLTLQGAAGTSGDVFVRLMAPYLAEYLGGNATFVVVNMPGAGGEIAYNDIAMAAADGTKINLATLPPLVSRLAEKADAAYTLDHFIYLGKVTSAPGAIAVSQSSEFQTLVDLVEHVRAIRAR
jgi:tripartite-type tricarboxylate transporter receptor subunit TctC